MGSESPMDGAAGEDSSTTSAKGPNGSWSFHSLLRELADSYDTQAAELDAARAECESFRDQLQQQEGHRRVSGLLALPGGQGLSISIPNSPSISVPPSPIASSCGAGAHTGAVQDIGPPQLALAAELPPGQPPELPPEQPDGITQLPCENLPGMLRETYGRPPSKSSTRRSEEPEKHVVAVTSLDSGKCLNRKAGAQSPLERAASPQPQSKQITALTVSTRPSFPRTCEPSESDAGSPGCSPRSSAQGVPSKRRNMIASIPTWEVQYPLATRWTEKQDLRRIQLAVNKTKTRTDSKQRSWAESVGSRESPRKCKSRVDTRMQRFISNPASPSRLVWDLIGALLIFYDLVVLPLQVCFQFDDVPFTISMDWATLFFWTLNMPMSCAVGFSRSGELVMDPVQIVKNYMRAWFWLDLAVVIPDWVFTLASLTSADGNKEQSGESVKLLRILRLVRIVRLLRLMKLRQILKNFDELINTEYTSIISNVIRMILLLLAVNHFVACVWFLIADNQKEATTWLTEQRYKDSHWMYQYTTALHWSLTQFTPASMDVQPHNIVERVFTVNVVVFGLVGFSYMVGSITGSLSQLRFLAQDESRQFWDLRCFLKQNKVPVRLSHRIQKYLEHAWQTQNKVRDLKSISILGLLSEQLFRELQYELCVPYFAIHPLFKRMCEECTETMQRLANSAISTKHLARDDFLFLSGEKATHMYIVVHGRLDYSRVDKQKQEHRETVDCNEDWIAEPILWTPHWVHLGTLVACKESRLLLIDPDTFRQCVGLNPQALWLCSRYAEKFLQWLNSQDADNLSDITQGEVSTDMMLSFMPDLDDNIGFSALSSSTFTSRISK